MKRYREELEHRETLLHEKKMRGQTSISKSNIYLISTFWFELRSSDSTLFYGTILPAFGTVSGRQHIGTVVTAVIYANDNILELRFCSIFTLKLQCAIVCSRGQYEVIDCSSQVEWVQIQAMTFASCVIPGELLNLTKPQYFHL